MELINCAGSGKKILPLAIPSTFFIGKSFIEWNRIAEGLLLLLFQVVFPEKVYVAVIFFLPVENRVIINWDNHLLVFALPERRYYVLILADCIIKIHCRLAISETGDRNHLPAAIQYNSIHRKVSRAEILGNEIGYSCFRSI